MTYSNLEEQIEVPLHNAEPEMTPSRLNVAAVLLRLVAPIALLAIGIGAYTYFAIAPEKEKAPKAESKPIRTSATELAIEDYQVIIKTNGIVQAHNEVSLSAQVSGTVLQVNPVFEVGSYFSKGDVLLELDARDYQTALAVAEAQLLGAESALELATETYQRNKNLNAKNGVSKAVLKQSFAAKAQAAAQLDTAKAQVEQSKRDLERTKIVAAFDGRVRTRNVGVGQLVGGGAALGSVFAVDFAEVRLPISSAELQYIKLPELSSDPSVPVELTDSIIESESVWNAKIVRTEGTLDLDSLNVFAIARIDDPFGVKSGEPPLRIGQPVVASIRGKILKDVVAIPRAATRQLDQVYFINEDEEGALTLKNRKLEPVWSDEENLIIHDPTIKDGQKLARSRIVYAPDGAKVEIIPEIGEVELTASNEEIETTGETKPVSK